MQPRSLYPDCSGRPYPTSLLNTATLTTKPVSFPCLPLFPRHTITEFHTWKNSKGSAPGAGSQSRGYGVLGRHCGSRQQSTWQAVSSPLHRALQSRSLPALHRRPSTPRAWHLPATLGLSYISNLQEGPGVLAPRSRLSASGPRGSLGTGNPPDL